jgi:hypothetical protein
MRALLLLGLTLAGSACVYDFPRTLKDGQVQATVLDADGHPAKTAHASIPGTERLAEADGKGVVVFLGLPVVSSLLQLTVDDDGDGHPEQAAYVPFHTELARVAKNLGDGALSEPPEVTTGVLLGNVKLKETGTVTGTVLDDGAALAAGRTAQVLVLRRVTLADDLVVTLPVEQRATTAADGTFSLAGVLAGDVTLVALVGDDGQPADHFGLADVTDGAVTDLDASQALTAGQTADLELHLFGGKERTELSTAFFFSPGTQLDFPGVEPQDIGEGVGGAFLLQAPQGVFDLQAETSDTPAGVLHNALALPGIDNNVAVPVELPTLADPCKSGKKRDCDRDGKAGLSGDDSEALDACVDACGGLRGKDLEGAVCGNIDCDDDADGVADVDERACIGAQLGVDTDGDGVCEPGADGE